MSFDPMVINDPVFRQQVIDLNMSLPHPQTVFTNTLKQYDEQLYWRLCAMEAFCYDHSTRQYKLYNGFSWGPNGTPLIDGSPVVPHATWTPPNHTMVQPPIEEYRPHWQRYASAVNSYLTHPPVSRGVLKDFIVAIWCFMGVFFSRGEGSLSLLQQGFVNQVFNMDGHGNQVMSGDIDYFDDYVTGDALNVVVDTTGEEPTYSIVPTPSTAAKLSAAVTKIEGFVSIEFPEMSIPGAWTKDAAKIEVLTDTYSDVVSDAGVKAAFSNPKAPEVLMTPLFAWDTIFDEMGWKAYVDNSGSTFKVPPRPE